nr:MAG TPA: hypothetical protein [Caudoviricetes sp.]
MSLCSKRTLERVEGAKRMNLVRNERSKRVQFTAQS